MYAFPTIHDLTEIARSWMFTRDSLPKPWQILVTKQLQLIEIDGNPLENCHLNLFEPKMVFFSPYFNQVSLDESDLKRLFLSCLLHSSSAKLMFSLDRGGLYRPCNVPLGVEVDHQCVLLT